MSVRFEMNVDSSELQAMEKAFRSYSTRVNREIRGAVTVTTRAIGKKARSRIRSKSGTLKKRVRVRMERDVNVGWVESRAPHSHLVEGGTKRHSLGKGIKRIDGEPVSGDVIHPGSQARPFLRPSYEEEAPKLPKRIKEILKNE